MVVHRAMLRRIYDWCIDAAHKPSALWIMGAVSFAESSFFPVPPDVMLIPMSLARPERAWLYASVCTATSVLGGILGYAIGALLYDSIGHWLIQFYGLGGKVEAFRAGYAEVAKYGVLGDGAFFAWLESNHADIFAGGAAREHAIATSCRAKAAIVARDERETGERALLNLGHTFGHALEAATGFSDRLFHGEGVAVGMVLAAEFSAQLGMISESDAARVRHHLAEVGLPTHLQDIAGFTQEGLGDADALMTLMAQDKKVKRGKLTFILLQAVGRAVIAPDVEPSLVRDFLSARLARKTRA